MEIFIICLLVGILFYIIPRLIAEPFIRKRKKERLKNSELEKQIRNLFLMKGGTHKSIDDVFTDNNEWLDTFKVPSFENRFNREENK